MQRWGPMELMEHGLCKSRPRPYPSETVITVTTVQMDRRARGANFQLSPVRSLLLVESSLESKRTTLNQKTLNNNKCSDENG